MDEPPHHRKIELQSPEDLTYLVDNIRRAAAVEIEKALPQIHTVAAEERREDDMRVVVERLVDEYIQTTLQTLLPNITINGLPPSPSLIFPPGFSSPHSPSNPNPTSKSRSKKSSSQNQPLTKEQIIFEPFNAKIWSKATDLMAQEAELIEEIARLRRSVPGKVVEREKSSFEKIGGDDEEIIDGLKERGGREGDEAVEMIREGEMDGERLESVKMAYGNGVKGLEGVVERGPGLVARVEKAERAEGYVRGGR